MLQDVTIVIPTFHRRGYLRDCLDGIQKNLPECPVRIAQDDGGDCTLEYSDYHTYYWAKLPYDSGLTAKRNAGVKLVETKHTLIGSDDFDFSTAEARKGIIEMAMALKYHPEVDVVAGRVNNRPYEGYLDYVPGEYIKEHRMSNWDAALAFIPWPLPLWKVDIAANYFLARTQVLREIPWDESIRPIGGEHVDWFLDMKAAGKIVVVMPYASIDAMPYDASKQHPDYRQLRRRALTTGHALMMKKRNIKKYYGFDEEVK